MPKVDYLKRTGEVKRELTFNDFTPTTLNNLTHVVSKNDKQMVMFDHDDDDKIRCCAMYGELNALQYKTDEPILIDPKTGDIAEEGADCVVNPDIILQRVDGNISIATAQ